MLLTVACVLSISSADAGQWQGNTVLHATGKTQMSHRSDWLILDTGGSGGGFGQGQPHGCLQDVHFWDRPNGVAIGYSGLFRTTDGGLTWEERPLAPVVSADGKRKGRNWYSVRMAGPKEIWALGQIHPGGLKQTALRHSMDDGLTWTEVLRGQLGHATRLHFSGPLDRWVICRWPRSFHSGDGGRTWSPVDWGRAIVPRDLCFPGDARLPSGAVGYAVGHGRGPDPEAIVLKSVDGGRTWQDVTPRDNVQEAMSCCFVSSWRGWVLGKDGLLATEDGGDTWVRHPIPPQMRRIWFFQHGRGWAVGGGGFYQGRFTSEHSLWQTGDGGRTWQPILGGRKGFRSIYSLGPGTGWAVGSGVGFVGNDLVAIYDPVPRWDRALR